MKITTGFLLLVLTSYSEGKSFNQELMTSQTNHEDLRLKRSVFGIVPKRRMEKIVNGQDIKSFHNKFVKIKLKEKARLMKLHEKKHLKQRGRRAELCSIMALSLKHLCRKINWKI